MNTATTDTTATTATTTTTDTTATTATTARYESKDVSFYYAVKVCRPSYVITTRYNRHLTKHTATLHNIDVGCYGFHLSSIITYLFTYLLTPWCRVLLEKLTGLQLAKKFPAFHGARRLITALTSVRQLSLSWACPIESIYPHPTSWRSILILSTHLRLGLPSGLLPFGFPTNTLYTPSPHPYAPHAQPISFISILSPAQYWVRSTNHLAPRYAISSTPPLPRPS